MIDDALLEELNAGLPRSGAEAAERAVKHFFAEWRLTCSCKPIDLREDSCGQIRCNACDAPLIQLRRGGRPCASTS